MKAYLRMISLLVLGWSALAKGYTVTVVNDTFHDVDIFAHTTTILCCKGCEVGGKCKMSIKQMSEGVYKTEKRCSGACWECINARVFLTQDKDEKKAQEIKYTFSTTEGAKAVLKGKIPAACKDIKLFLFEVQNKDLTHQYRLSTKDDYIAALLTYFDPLNAFNSPQYKVTSSLLSELTSKYKHKIDQIISAGGPMDLKQIGKINFEVTTGIQDVYSIEKELVDIELMHPAEAYKQLIALEKRLLFFEKKTNYLMDWDEIANSLGALITMLLLKKAAEENSMPHLEEALDQAQQLMSARMNSKIKQQLATITNKFNAQNTKDAVAAQKAKEEKTRVDKIAVEKVVADKKVAEEKVRLDKMAEDRALAAKEQYLLPRYRESSSKAPGLATITEE